MQASLTKNSMTTNGPLMAVVIPIFKQPFLVVEAIESLLAQKTSFGFRVVLVNDGCPFPETHRVCRSYAVSYPDRISYIHKSNGGLSSARNAGIDLVLASWSTVEAIHFLDADDRLHPYFMSRAHEALTEDPQAGWVTPDIANFGASREYVDLAGEYSVLEHLHYNYCAVSGVIRRAVFETGLRYDEQMKLGYEDWDFWLSAAERGFRGIHRKDLGFQYRRRIESMVQDSAQKDGEIKSYMRRKHAGLYNVRRCIELEHEELPRFLIYEGDRGQFALCTDPTRRDQRMDVADLASRLPGFHDSRQRFRLPPYVAVSSAAALDAIGEAGVAPGLFWRMQVALESSQAVLARVELGCAPERFVSCHGVPPHEVNDPEDGATILMVQIERFLSCLANRAGHWIDTTRVPNPDVDVCGLQLLVVRSGRPPEIPHRAVGDLRSLERSIGYGYRAGMAARQGVGDVRSVYQGRCGRTSTRIVSTLFDTGSVFPSVLDSARIQVGYVLPICEFGGVERVVQNLGQASVARGWDPHMFVIGSGSARILREFQDAFKTITVVPEAEAHSPEQLCGLLGGMDVVINNNCAPVYSIQGRLRRLGVKTIANLHSIITTPDGFTEGYPYTALGLEHGLDGVIVISEALRRWCLAWGVPESKLIFVPNGPSFTISQSRVETTLSRRETRSSELPLRVLHMGRFDIEKGMDRLLALHQLACRRNAPIEWRVVGKAVLRDGAGRAPDLTALSGVMHPPALTAESIARHYSWADVMLLPSKFEGVPLSILEAQQFGCVVLATNVGAIPEIVDDGKTGFLFPNELTHAELVGMMLEKLIELQADRGALLDVARASARRGLEQTWTVGFAPLAKFIEALVRNG